MPNECGAENEVHALLLELLAEAPGDLQLLVSDGTGIQVHREVMKLVSPHVLGPALCLPSAKGRERKRTKATPTLSVSPPCTVVGVGAACLCSEALTSTVILIRAHACTYACTQPYTYHTHAIIHRPPQ